MNGVERRARREACAQNIRLKSPLSTSCTPNSRKNGNKE